MYQKIYNVCINGNFKFLNLKIMFYSKTIKIKIERINILFFYKLIFLD